MEGQWGGEVEEDAADARRDTLHSIPAKMDTRPIRLASTLYPLLDMIPVCLESRYTMATASSFKGKCCSLGWVLRDVDALSKIPHWIRLYLGLAR